MTDEEIINNVTSEETPAVEQTNEAPVEETKVEQTNVEPKVEPVAEPPAEKMYSQSEYDKMVYSFRKQMGKAKDKWTEQINNYEKRFKDFDDKLNKITNPEKPLRRDDFKSDDEFIEALINNGVEKRWAEKEKLMREEYEKYEAQQKEEYEHRKELDEGINKWWPNAEERKKFVETVQGAFDKGLSKLLEEEQNVMNYLHQTPNQSLVLYELATNPNAVQEVFSIKNPLMRLMAVRDIENRLVAERNAPTTTPTPTPTPAPQVSPSHATQQVNNLAKPVGKPGTQVDAEPDLFSNEDSLLNFIRGN